MKPSVRSVIACRRRCLRRRRKCSANRLALRRQGIGGPMVDSQVPAKPCRSPPLGGGRGIGGPMVDTHLGPKSFRKLTWREGTKNKLSSRFCFVRVKVAEDDGVTIAEHEPLWLIAEWPDGGKAPTKFFRTTLARRMGKKQIVRQERWRTERMYEDLKGELGLDHFEGRSFPGWHHHVSVVLCCYAFVIAERSRSFPPLDSKDACKPCARRCGLNATSVTPSSPFASPSPTSSRAGFLVAPSASSPILPHAASDASSLVPCDRRS